MWESNPRITEPQSAVLTTSPIPPCTTNSSIRCKKNQVLISISFIKCYDYYGDNMVVQDLKEIKFDSCVRKARVLIKDKDDKLMLITIEGSYCLIGGTVEDGEDTKTAAMREVEEEAGLYLTDCDYITTISHYHQNFPCLKEDRIGNRLNIIDYYYADLDEDLLGEAHPTDYEREHDMKIIRVTTDELYSLLGSEPNSFKSFMDEELKEIIDYAKEKGII